MAHETVVEIDVDRHTAKLAVFVERHRVAHGARSPGVEQREVQASSEEQAKGHVRYGCFAAAHKAIPECRGPQAAAAE